MKKTAKIIILFVFLLSCNNNLDYNIDKNRPSNMRTEYHDSLKKCIINYIRSVDGQFLNKRWLYYSVFFHDVGTNNYLIIWTFTSYPDNLCNTIDTSIYDFYLYNLMRNIVFIKKKKSINSLFSGDAHNIELANKESLIPYGGPIYDGSCYPETYEYFFKNGVIEIVRKDTIFPEILGADFVDFENLFVTNKNGLRARKHS